MVDYLRDSAKHTRVVYIKEAKLVPSPKLIQKGEPSDERKLWRDDTFPNSFLPRLDGLSFPKKVIELSTAEAPRVAHKPELGNTTTYRAKEPNKNVPNVNDFFKKRVVADFWLPFPNG